MRFPVGSLLTAGILTAALVGAGVVALGGTDEPEHRAAPFRTTPLADYDTSTAHVVRGPFCRSIDDRQVEAALGAEPATSTAWTNGDRVEVTDGVEDVGHEFGCQYAAADGTLARAWVFAPPVTSDEAERLARGAGKGAGCAAGSGPAYGAPTLALTCTKDGGVRASYRGLFGDAWLVCELVRPPGATWDAVDRAGRWCVGVLEAASGVTA